MNRINSNYVESIMRSTRDTVASYAISGEQGEGKTLWTTGNEPQ